MGISNAEYEARPTPKRIDHRPGYNEDRNKVIHLNIKESVHNKIKDIARSLDMPIATWAKATVMEKLSYIEAVEAGEIPEKDSPFSDDSKNTKSEADKTLGVPEVYRRKPRTVKRG